MVTFVVTQDVRSLRHRVGGHIISIPIAEQFGHGAAMMLIPK